MAIEQFDMHLAILRRILELQGKLLVRTKNSFEKKSEKLVNEQPVMRASHH